MTETETPNALALRRAVLRSLKESDLEGVIETLMKLYRPDAIAAIIHTKTGVIRVHDYDGPYLISCFALNGDTVAPSSDSLTLYRYQCTNKGYTEDLGNGVTLTLMLIPAGEFMMGAPENETGSEDSERPQHRVRVPQFLMGRTPVTQAQWREVARYAREDIDLKADPL